MKNHVLLCALCAVITAVMMLTSCQAFGAVKTDTSPTSSAVTGPAGGTVLNSVGKLMEKPQYGGTLTICFSRGPAEGWDPLRANGAASNNFIYGIYEKLGLGDYTKSIPGTGEWVKSPTDLTWHWFVPIQYYGPCLAESWEQSPDGLSIIFHIRKGVHFQNKAPVNGREMTAADVKYTFDRFWATGSGFTKQNPQYAYNLPGYSQIASCECPNQYTVVITRNGPWMRWLYELLSSQASKIIPREMVDKYGDLEDWRNACGTGPYMLTDYVADGTARYERNPNYWCKDELLGMQLPYIDTINVLAIQDASARIAAFRVNKIDYLPQGISDANKTELTKANPNLVWAVYSNELGVLLHMRLDKAPYNNLKVRQALQCALDLQGEANTVPGTRFGPVTMFIVPQMGSGRYVPWEKMPADIQKDFNYDTARARQLLADAGYPNGFTTEVVTTVASDLLTSVKTDWAKVGITCNFRIVQAQVYSGTLLRRNYTDMCAVISGAAGYQNNAATFSSTSYTPAYSPEFDELQNQFVTEVATDLDKSYALTVDMQNMAMRNHWAIHLVPSPGSNIVWYPWLKNVWCSTADNNAWIPVLARCWIDQDLRFKVTGVKQTPSNFKGAR